MKYPRHLLQSPGWANFRKNWGTKVVDIGKAYFTVHPVPFLPYTIGYMARPFPEDIDWKEFAKKAKENKCIFVKVEPNSAEFKAPKGFKMVKGSRIFAYGTYIIDLQKSDEELLKAMHQKTRYNLNLARRKGVQIKIGHDDKMIAEFLTLFHETSDRHKIFLHPDSYYKAIIETFKKEGTVEIVTGYYEGTPLASMVVVFYGDTLFFPYGGSIHLHKEVMPFYLVYWEAFQLGKKRGAKYFDMWNCLTPEQEDPKHIWYGFHKFKKGFNGEYLPFAGAFDVIFEPMLYPLVILLNKLRWIILKTGALLKRVIKR